MWLPRQQVQVAIPICIDHREDRHISLQAREPVGPTEVLPEAIEVCILSRGGKSSGPVTSTPEARMTGHQAIIGQIWDGRLQRVMSGKRVKHCALECLWLMDLVALFGPRLPLSVKARKSTLTQWRSAVSGSLSMASRPACCHDALMSRSDW